VRPWRIAIVAIAFVIVTPAVSGATSAPAPRWISRFGSRCGSSDATAIAASPLGNTVFVMGE
jgi:hypothetical protein